MEEFTQQEELLLLTLEEFPLDQDDITAIFCTLQRDLQKYLMMEFLVTHPEATQQEILNRLVDIILQTKESESLSES